MNDDNSPKARLENLISLYRGGKVSAEHFCAAFEQIYNLGSSPESVGALLKVPLSLRT
jgi:hypothetical protein